MGTDRPTKESCDLLELAGVVVCLWDDYGQNCVCDRCKTNGMAGNWGRQVAFAVGAWERALKPLGQELIVRTWASGASHWLGKEAARDGGDGAAPGRPHERGNRRAASRRT